MANKKHINRPIPCPRYDVEGLESWLGDMARKGWLLEKDGFFLGFAGFTRDRKKAVRYRLDAVPNRLGLWRRYGEKPDAEALALSHACGWDYVARLGQFYVYRSADPEARELNTDPEVQAIVLNALRGDLLGSLLLFIFWLALYPVLRLRGALLLSAIEVGFGFFLFQTVLALVLIVDQGAAVLHLRRLRDRLRRGLPLQHDRDWKRGRLPFFLRKAGLIAATAVWVVLLLCRWGAAVQEKGAIALQEFTGEVPFATLAELAGGTRDTVEYEWFFNDIRFDRVIFKSDVLAPVNIDWSEHALVTAPDGQTLDGGLWVCYHEAASEFIAKRIAAEYLCRDRHKKGFSLLEAPALGLDSVVAYRNDLHFPTVILRQGRTVVQAFFYASGEDSPALEEWAAVLADSIR